MVGEGRGGKRGWGREGREGEGREGTGKGEEGGRGGQKRVPVQVLGGASPPH